MRADPTPSARGAHQPAGRAPSQPKPQAMQWFMLSPWFKHLCCCRVIACLLIGLGSLGLAAQPSPEISAVSSLSSSATNSPIAEVIVLDSNAYHLGVDGLPEWRSFEGRHPHGRELHL
ncbi:MAG: hypothetical protein VW804_03220, partial [Verrucomicrobiota bacterium]